MSSTSSGSSSVKIGLSAPRPSLALTCRQPYPQERQRQHLKTKGKLATPAAEQFSSIVDKLELVLPLAAMSPAELEMAGANLQTCDAVKKISSKGSSYERVYVLTCPSGAKVVFALGATAPQMRYAAKITLNPSQMENGDADARAFYKTLKALFSIGYKERMRQLLIARVDQAYDHPVQTSDLLFHLPGSPSEEKYFVRTDNSGCIRSWYCGSIRSRVHGVMYDQVASDAYKVSHGEMPSRARPRDDAELVFESSSTQGMTRIEARRVFDKPLPLRKVDDQEPALGRFKVYKVDAAKIADAPSHFSMFLDSMRLRGLTGATKQYLEHHPDRGGKKNLKEFSEYLNTCAVPWLEKAGLNSSIEQTLSDKPIWKVLKHLAH